MLVEAALGLTSESEELAEHIKKHFFHDKPLDREAVKKKLGDVLWYCAQMATALGYGLNEVAAHNIDKLRVRYPDKFNAADSARRRDVEEGVDRKEYDPSMAGLRAMTKEEIAERIGPGMSNGYVSQADVNRRNVERFVEGQD